jgi:hypothetical protein
MRPVVALLLLTSMAAMLAGCRKPSTPSVSYEVRGGGGFTKGITQDGSFIVGDNKLELKDGRVFANGKYYGQVKNGDSILLDTDRQLYVNEEKRREVPEP